MYFTGSAVVDVKNTSGFGKNGKTPIVGNGLSLLVLLDCLSTWQGLGNRVL
jgi:hypothetical protein